MEIVKVAASRRVPSTKGASRRLRAESKIPAVVYGPGHSTEALAVSPKEISAVLHAEHGKNTVVEIGIDGGEAFTALVTEYQYHPVTRQLIHADFLRIKPEDQVSVEVPFEVTGKPKGVIMGGTLGVVFRALPVKCQAIQVPVKLEIDITELDLNQHYSVSDLKLPEGVTVQMPQNQTLVSVMEDKRKKAEAEAAAAAAVPGKAAGKKK